MTHYVDSRKCEYHVPRGINKVDSASSLSDDKTKINTHTKIPRVYKIKFPEIVRQVSIPA